MMVISFSNFRSVKREVLVCSELYLDALEMPKGRRGESNTARMWIIYI